MSSYYLAIEGKQKGPFSSTEVKSMLASGKIQTASLYWQDGMDTWKRLEEALPALNAAVPEVSDPAELNPYAPPRHSSMPVSRQSVGGYGGIGRAMYFGINMLIQTGFLLFTTGSKRTEDDLFMLGLVGTIVVVPLVFFRLKNIGFPRWIIFLLFVPVINILVGITLGFVCLVCQEGYAHTKRLDVVGQRIALGLAALFALALILLLMT